MDIRLCASRDGARIAWATAGRGPPVVKSANWRTHLELGRASPLWRHWFRDLVGYRCPITYDGRGYGRGAVLRALFALEPALRDLFKSDLDAQGRKLVAMISVAVGSLQLDAELRPALQALGRRHAGYGVRDEHYDSVGAALLWTLELASARRSRTRSHRRGAAYATLAEAMRHGALQPAAVA